MRLHWARILGIVKMSHILSGATNHGGVLVYSQTIMRDLRNICVLSRPRLSIFAEDAFTPAPTAGITALAPKLCLRAGAASLRYPRMGGFLGHSLPLFSWLISVTVCVSLKEIPRVE